MKIKFLLAFALGGALSLSAQGFKDGVEYYRADQPEEAFIILTNTLNQSGTNLATAHYYLGQIAFKNGDKAAAKKHFDKGLEADEANGYNYVGLGAIALADGDLSQAKSYFKDAKKKAKKNADILTEIARAYFDADPVKYAKEIDDALKDAKKAVDKAPAPYILEGDRLAKTNVGDAAGMYEMAASFDVNQEHPEAYVKYARVYFPVNEQYAINKLKELLKLQPNSALAQRELAEKYYEANQLTRAAQQYEQYIQNPNSFKKDKQRLVGLLFFAQRYPESYALASELLNEDPANFYMQRMQFYNKKALNDTVAAHAAAQTLFANPAAQINAQDYTQFGELLQDMGKDSVAVEMYEKAVAIAPEKVALIKELSSAYAKAEMYEKAALAMEKYMGTQDEVNPNDLLTLALRWNSIAATKMGTDQEAFQAAAQKALTTINQVVERVPDNPLVLNWRSNIIRVANGGVINEEALAADEATLALLDSDPANLTKRANIYVQVLGRLGNYWIEQKDNAKAKEYFERYYQISPSEQLRTFIDGLVVTPAE